jgi:hypothetical protein
MTEEHRSCEECGNGPKERENLVCWECQAQGRESVWVPIGVARVKKERVNEGV